jgi:hypothetical protein
MAPTPDDGTTVSAGAIPPPTVQPHVLDENDSKA